MNRKHGSRSCRPCRAGNAVAWWGVLGILSSVLRATTVLAATNSECLYCHSSKLPVRRIDPALTLDPSTYSASVHGKHITCDGCHVGVGTDLLSHKDANTPVQCIRCHGQKDSVVPEQYRDRYDSIHRRPRKAGVSEVPTCKDCHGDHDIEAPSLMDSRVNKVNIRVTCGKCHGSPGSDIAHKAPQTAVDYDKSFHGRKENHPGLRTATCTDCHLPHNPKAKASTEPIDKVDIPGICGRCHPGIYSEYRSTIHGRDLARGIKDVPACTDCHGEHTIRPPWEAASSVSPLHVVRTCTKCHENKRILRQYGLPAGRYSTYRDSFHGISNRFGDVRAANCASCHTAHRILPASDPQSSVNPANRVKTCGQHDCHEKATENFAKGTVHLAPSQSSDAVVYWVGLCYKGMVLGTISLFVGLILLDLSKRVRLREKHGPEGGEAE